MEAKVRMVRRRGRVRPARKSAMGRRGDEGREGEGDCLRWRRRIRRRVVGM